MCWMQIRSPFTPITLGLVALLGGCVAPAPPQVTQVSVPAVPSSSPTVGLDAAALPSEAGSEASAPDAAAAAIVDSPRDTQALQNACDGGNASACFELSELYEAGNGVAKDAARARALAEKACEVGGLGCAKLAEDYEKGVGVKKDVARATALYKRDCELHQGPDPYLSCAIAARRLYTGDGVRKDVAASVGLYEAICPNGYYGACETLAAIYREGRYVPRDLEKAKQLQAFYIEVLDDQCFHSSNSDSCTELAKRYRQGRGVGKDEALARKAELQSAGLRCSSGSGAGCYELALIFRNGRGVPKDESNAAEYFARGCAAGHKPSCAQAGKR